ncbi:hypothetical protein ACFQ67_16630 [Streptomyces sp. NPDC056488]|uniref:hypothetical protein n=1 Tax=unclassified Streptomyces TaxID=2593676 RepID=UPI0036B09F5A
MTGRRQGARSAVVTMLYGRRPADGERRGRDHRPAARRARWFGTPLVPLLTAAVVATAFLSVRGGEDDGNPTSAPSPVVTEEAGPDTAPPATGSPSPGASGAGSTDTPEQPDTTHDGAPTTAATRGGTPTRTGPGDRTPRTGASPVPSRTGSTPSASTAPTPSGTPKGERRSGRPVSFEALRVGDCFDIDRAAPGTVVRRPCDTPHSAELVSRPRLTGRYATDRAVREAATELCREPLRRKAARQPLGTRWTTFVQYPYRTSHLLGSDTAACSLVAPSAGGTISHRLR